MNSKTIEIYLNDKEEYINEFNDKRLSSNLSNYILEECKGIPHKEKLTFLIKTTFNMDDKEKEKFISMLRNNYGADISEMMHVSKKIYLMNILLFLLGLFFIIIYFLIANTAIISEVILIIGWVFIWESTYNFFFKGIEKKLKISRRKQIINSKIIFEKI